MSQLIRFLAVLEALIGRYLVDSLYLKLSQRPVLSLTRNISRIHMQRVIIDYTDLL